MKFSITNRQDATYLRKADEILIQWRDRRALPDYTERYPSAALVLEGHPTDMPIDYDEIKEYAILAQGRLTLSLPEISYETTSRLREMEIPYFYAYPASTAWELAGLVASGVSQVRIEAPLFFQTELLKSYDIPKRITPNVAHEGYIPGQQGIIGSWIRPEDLELYEDIFTTVEFRDISKKSREQAFYRIYAEQKAWPGPLNTIISNLDIENPNRMLPREFTEHRLNCGQRCTTGGACRLCYRYINLANPDLIKEYASIIQNT